MPSYFRFQIDQLIPALSVKGRYDSHLLATQSHDHSEDAPAGSFAEIGPALFAIPICIEVNFERITEENLRCFFRGYIVLGEMADIPTVPIEESFVHAISFLRQK